MTAWGKYYMMTLQSELKKNPANGLGPNTPETIIYAKLVADSAYAARKANRESKPEHSGLTWDILYAMGLQNGLDLSLGATMIAKLGIDFANSAYTVMLKSRLEYEKSLSSKSPKKSQDEDEVVE